MVLVAKAATRKSKDRDKWIIAADMPENVARAIDWLKNKAKIATQGQGGDHCTYATAAYLKSLGVSQGTALDLMLEHWNDRCEPPWDGDELETKVANGYKYNSKPPGCYTEAYKITILKELFAPVAADIPSGKQKITGIFTVRDSEAMPHIQPPNWLIENCIPDDSYAILFGTFGAYKTFLALDMALTLARESDDIEGLVWSAVTQGPVLFCVGEGLPNLNKRKLGWEAVHNDGKPVQDFILVDPVPPSVIDDQHLKDLIDLALEFRPDGYALTVIDTISRSMTGANENDQADASRFTGLVHRLKAELGGSVLALHHTGVEDVDRPRGSSVFAADTDTLIKSEALPNRIAKLTMVKQKDADAWEKPKHAKMAVEHETLVVVLPSLEEIASAKPKVAEDEFAQEANVRYIIAALHTYAGRKWSVKELAVACRDKGCEIPMNSLQTRVLGTRDRQDGWARSHPALSKYWRNSPQQWVTPSQLPEIPNRYILDEDEN